MKAIGMILIASLCLACAATRGARDPRKAEAGFLGDYSMLQETSGPGARLRYVREGVDWKRYDKMMVDPVMFWKSADVEANLSGAAKQGLVNYFHAAVHDRMAQDYQMVSLPQPNTLRLSVAFTRLGDRNVTLDTVSTYVPQLRLLSELKTVATGKPSFVGEAAFEGKLTDAHTGELLRAEMDKRVGGKTLKNLDDWADVKKAMDYWIGGFGYNMCKLRGGTDCNAP